MSIETSKIVHHIYEDFIEKKKKFFFILGTASGHGNTYCSKKVAMAAAASIPGIASILLMDMNMYHASLSIESGNPEKGWLNWMATNGEEGEITDYTIPFPHVEKIDLLPQGRSASYESLPVSTFNWNLLFGKLKEKYDIIIADLPPYYHGVEARTFCGFADSVIITIEAEVSRRPLVIQMTDALNKAGIQIGGVIFNKRKYHIPAGIYRRLF